MSNHVTFGEAKLAIRTLRRVHRAVRDAFAAAPSFDAWPREWRVSREAFEQCEWALARVKQWVPELDDEQEVIPGRGRFVRAHMVFCLAGEPRPHFVLKGIPVFCE